MQGDTLTDDAARSSLLCLVFTDLVGYTSRTAKQSHEENEALLRAHDDLLLPIVAHFGGVHRKSIGDALLVGGDSVPSTNSSVSALE